MQTPDIWRFSNAAGEEVAVKPKGQLRANNGDALMPALIAGLGIGDLPEFIVKEALADGRLKRVLTDWLTQQGSLFLVTPPGGPRPARVEVLADFLGERLARRG
ncbi:LysR family transcriptional regulator (fragment) [Methylocella tundrae]